LFKSDSTVFIKMFVSAYSIYPILIVSEELKFYS
jgi:hypothetical protein